MQPVLCKHFGLRGGVSRFGCVYSRLGSYLVVEIHSSLLFTICFVTEPRMFLNVLPPSDGDMPSTVATRPPRLHPTMRNLRGGGIRVGTGQQTGKSLSLMKSLCRILFSESQSRLVF